MTAHAISDDELELSLDEVADRAVDHLFQRARAAVYVAVPSRDQRRIFIDTVARRIRERPIAQEPRVRYGLARVEVGDATVTVISTDSDAALGAVATLAILTLTPADSLTSRRLYLLRLLHAAAAERGGEVLIVRLKG